MQEKTFDIFFGHQMPKYYYKCLYLCEYCCTALNHDKIEFSNVSNFVQKQGLLELLTYYGVTTNAQTLGNASL